MDQEYRGREKGDIPGYTPTPEALRLQEVYGNWVHANPGTHLHGGIGDNETWQRWWHDLAVVFSRRYGMLSRKVRRCFVVALVGELRGARDILWDLERFIVFQTVILQQDHHVTKSQAICWSIEKRLDAWEAGRHEMMVEETLHTCAQYLTSARREESEEHRDKTYHSLVFQGKLRMLVRWITEQ